MRGLETGVGEYLEAQDFGLGEREGFAVYFYETFSGLEGVINQFRCNGEVVVRWSCTLQCATAVAVKLD